MAITSKLKTALAGALGSSAASATQQTITSTTLTATQIAQMQSAIQQQQQFPAHTHSIGGYSGTTTGQVNTFIGQSAGIAHTIGSGNVYVGGYNNWPTLTQEELDEFNLLEEEYNRELKYAKISYFKSLPVETRQHVVNTILWQREAEKIKKIEEEVEAKMTDRFKQLRAKKSYTGSINNSWAGINNIYNGTIGAILPFLGGLTAEEIVAAHSDACAEEALTSI